MSALSGLARGSGALGDFIDDGRVVRFDCAGSFVARRACALPPPASRVRAEGKKTLGRPKVGSKVEETIRQQLAAGHGILKIAKLLGVGSGTVQRVKREMTFASVGGGVEFG